MADWFGWAIWFSAIAPLAAAWRANRGWSLRHAVIWAGVAWLAWGWHAIAGDAISAYAALTQTGCAGVAVLGARRPGVAAWDFVVLGLMIVLWLAAAEGALTGTALRLGSFRVLFLVGLIFVTVTNYLPTRLGLGAAGLAIACGLAMAVLLGGSGPPLAGAVAGASAWLARAGLRGRADRWIDFRDRYGMIWGQRVREQFNAAAANRGLSAELTWFGLTGESTCRPECERILDGLLMRFAKPTAIDTPAPPVTIPDATSESSPVSS